MKETLNYLFDHNILKREEAKDVLIRIGKGQYSDPEIASFLTVYLMRKITPRELAGFRDALLELCVSVNLSEYNTIVFMNFENWIFHELSIHNRYTEKFYDISYWRLTTGIEVDFILGKAEIAIEVKGKDKITSNDLRGLLQFKQEYPQVKQLILVSLEKKARLTKNGIHILPYEAFIEKLWQGVYL